MFRKDFASVGRIPERFKWIIYTLIRTLENTSLPEHLLFIGKTKSGKSYLIFQLIEWLFRVKTHKFFLLNCYEDSILEESLGLMFPNTNESDKTKIAKFNVSKLSKALNIKIKPQKIKLKVYTPLMPNDLPNKLPAIWQPFTIPVNELPEECLQILYGEVDTQKIYQLYTSKIKKGKDMSFPKVKKIFHEMEEIKAEANWEKGIGGERTIIYSEHAAHHTLRNFQTRLNYFNNYGILSNSKNPYSLKKFIKKDIQDRNTVSILDLTRLEDNQMMQFFVLTFFLRTIQQTAAKMDVIPFKICLIIDEARFIMARKEEGKRGYHKGIQDFIHKGLTSDRKKSMEYWLSTQSPANVRETTYKNMKTKFVTELTERKDIEWLKEEFRDTKVYEIKHLLEKMSYLRDEPFKDYRFILIGQSKKQERELESQASGRNPQDLNDVANKFPCPRANMYHCEEKVGGEKVTVYRPAIKNNYKLIKEQLALNGYPNPEIDITAAKQQLINEWKDEDMKIKQGIDKKTKKRTQQKRSIKEEKSKELKEIARARMKLKQKGERDNNLGKLSVMTGISREKIRTRFKESEQFMQENGLKEE